MPEDKPKETENQTEAKSESASLLPKEIQEAFVNDDKLLNS